MRSFEKRLHTGVEPDSVQGLEYSSIEYSSLCVIALKVICNDFFTKLIKSSF